MRMKFFCKIQKFTLQTKLRFLIKQCVFPIWENLSIVIRDNCPAWKFKKLFFLFCGKAHGMIISIKNIRQLSSLISIRVEIFFFLKNQEPAVIRISSVLFSTYIHYKFFVFFCESTARLFFFFVETKNLES